MTLDVNSLERLVPEDLDASEATGGETYRLHVERYAFAADNARPGRLLDIACGVGYGTQLLAERAPSVTAALGVDVAPEAVEYARAKYRDDRICFEMGDALTFADAEGFETIVSLETIEHLESEPEALVHNLKRLLKPGGVLISSAPTTPSVDVNPHHRWDFTERSFRQIFTAAGLREVSSFKQVQSVNVGSVIRKDEKRMTGIRRNLPLYFATHPGALAKRILTTLVHGFANHYITIAWEHDND
jgi:2-polyprenyl-3-methyl-5-hydroxy-6-metoxy-1,4-benzoquinol methylase